MNILERIIDYKKREVALRKMQITAGQLEKSPLFKRDALSLSMFLTKKEGSGIIAEFKRRSPSKGIINGTADPARVVSGYCRSGAAAVSVLTDTEFFGGSNDDLVSARAVCEIPILRKDFIIDDYQLIEARAYGADAVLLIAAVLGKKKVSDLAGTAALLGLQVLLEIHSPGEIEMAGKNINVIGVNNRDLGTFVVDTETSLKIAGLLPEDMTRISESGITSAEKIKILRNAGYHGFLIGEYFMSSSDPAVALSNFIKMIG